MAGSELPADLTPHLYSDRVSELPYNQLPNGPLHELRYVAILSQ